MTIPGLENKKPLSMTIPGCRHPDCKNILDSTEYWARHDVSKL